MLYQQALMEHILGITVMEPNWYLALYEDGTDPVANMATAEMAGTRVSVDLSFAWSTNIITNPAHIITGPLTTGATAGGWFMVNGSATECLWSCALTAPVVMLAGDTLFFPPTSITLAIV